MHANKTSMSQMIVLSCQRLHRLEIKLFDIINMKDK